METACPQCGTMNPPGSKFCFDCGHNLSLHPVSPPIELSFDEKIAKIRKYLPKGITEGSSPPFGTIEITKGNPP